MKLIIFLLLFMYVTACVAQSSCKLDSECASRQCGKNGFCCDSWISCGADCVDIETSSKHCGACGYSCGSSENCTAGVCIAMIPLTRK